MGQLVKSDFANLGALPLVDIVVPLNVGELHGRDDLPILVPEPPQTSVPPRVSTPDTPVYLLGLVPEAALAEYLVEIPAEDGAPEAGGVLIPQGRKKQPKGLSSSGCS